MAKALRIRGAGYAGFGGGVEWVKRDFAIQKNVLAKIERHDLALIEYQSFWHDVGGDEETRNIDWSNEEAYNIDLLVADGKLSIERVTQAAWLGDGDSDPYAMTYLKLNTSGHDLLDSPSWWQRAYRNVITNFATLFVAVLSAVIIQYIIINLNID